MTIRDAKRLARAALTKKDAAFFYEDGGIRTEARQCAAKNGVQVQECAFIPSPSPDLDINCILCAILNVNKTFLLMHSQNELTETQLKDFANAVNQRRAGLPVAYITGVKEFYGREFCVTPAVLIPKPDTELLVERAVEIVLQSGRTIKLCDLCTGSGCIGLSVFLAVQEKRKTGFGTIGSVRLSDISEAALEIAKLNAKRLLDDGDKNLFSFVQTDLFAGISDTFDLICTNPPYIPHTEAVELLKDGRNEPLLALDGDATCGETQPDGDGLAVIRRLIPAAFERLTGGGTLLMECGEYNAIQAADLCRNQGFSSVQVHKDLAGQLRLVEAAKA